MKCGAAKVRKSKGLSIGPARVEGHMASAEKHKYEYDIDLESDVAPARILRMIRPGARVLEIGAGPGSVTKYLSGALGCDVTALEVDPSALERLKQHARSIYAMDLNDPSWSATLKEKEGVFDYIIAADVLEHVYDPWLVLSAMKSLLSDTGAALLSIPHVGHAAIGACLVDEDFEYRPWGLLDKTHIRFFGLKNMQELCESQGLAVERAEFVVRAPEMTEFVHRWLRLPKDVRDALQRNRFSDVYQVIIKAVPEDRTPVRVRLMDMDVIPPERSVSSYWKEVMASIHPSANSDQRSTMSDRPRVSSMRTLRRAVLKKVGL